MATLQARQQAINKGLTGEDVQNYIDLALEIRSVVAETKQLSVNQEVLNDGANAFLSIWGAISNKIGEAVSKIPTMDDEQYQQFLYYQDYGRGRVAAPDDPVENKPLRKPSGGGASQQNPLEQLKKQLELERELVGVSEDRARVIKALGLDFVQKNPEIADGLQEQIAKTRELIEAEKERQSVLQTVETSLENGLMSMVEGTKSVKDAFKDMARSIIKELYDVYVVQRLVGGFGQNGGSGSGLLGLLGGLFGKASGGTVMSNQPYLVGEKGPELIVPRNRGHVMNADLTANAMNGGGTVVVNQSFNFQANGDESVKKLIAQAAPSIASMAKQSVVDARRRGGAMKNAFG